jgi:hypothetical protein
MPTYKLGPASVKGVPPKLIVRRPVICEQCAEALGTVVAAAEFKGMSAVLVAAMWPEMRQTVEEHEGVCPYRS